MLPKYHILVSILVSAVFYPFFGWHVWLIFAAGVLADSDHVLIHLNENKNLNIKEAYTFFKQLKDGSKFYPIFHMIELPIILFAVGLFYQPFLLISIGLLSHIFLDFLEEEYLDKTDRHFSIFS
ncbi:MAG: hypothetical protein R6U26_02500 [Candidatus Undinarchaeales archaeon]